MVGQPKTLLVYVTAGGATEQYARVVAEALRSRGHAVDVVDLKRDRVADLSPYANVIVGSGVRMAMVYRAAKQFLGRKDLEGKRLAVFLSSGIAVQDREKARERFLTPLVTKLSLTPVMYTALPGITPGQAGKGKDTSDLEGARQWALELAGKLEGGAR